LGDELVEVIVGGQSTKYTLYKTLLCQRSSFFQAAIAGSWTEAARNSITLEEDDSEAFNIFVYWIYRDHLPFSSDTTMTIKTAVEFSVLADKLLLPTELKVQALDCIKHICAQGEAELPAQVVAHVLKITALDCPLRRFMLDLTCYYYYWHIKKDEQGRTAQSNWLKDCLNDCDISEAVDVFDTFKDTLADSGRLKSLKRAHWTVFEAIDGTESLAKVARYQTGFLKQPSQEEATWEALPVD
jgi:hypothetical protein